MSFAKKAKLEVLSNSLEGDCCLISFLSGILHSSGEINIKNKKITVEIITEIRELCVYLNKIFRILYGQKFEIDSIQNYSVGNNLYYKLTIPENYCQQILFDCGIVEDLSGSFEFNKRLNGFVENNDCCKVAYIKGAFIGCSTTNIKLSEKASQKTSSGYHLEFTSYDFSFLSELSGILAGFNIIGKIFQRKNKYVFYIKEAGIISDLLALVGAHSSVLSLQNEIISREMRNKINRETNCFSANITKTVNASMRQLEAIKIINETIGVDTLPDDLMEVALLRLANQEESLEELLQLSTLQLTKSGLNHRFNKIIKLSETLK